MKNIKKFTWILIAVFALIAESSGIPAHGKTFSYRAKEGTRSVAVAGTFNKWSVTENKMSDSDGDGLWTIDIPIQAGKYEYKFVVNGIDWIPDPSNSIHTSDGMGGENSVIEITSAEATSQNNSNNNTSQQNQSTAVSSLSAATFNFRPSAGARSVTIAGSFNNWSSSANPLSDPDGDGVWSAEIRLAPGTYQYKFVVNGSDWVIDPANTKRVPDGLGGENSEIVIGGSVSSSVSTTNLTATSAAAEAAKPNGTLFIVDAPNARSVDLMGSWNTWSSPTVLAKGADGKWLATLNLAPGTYEYKFRQDGDWDALNKDNRSIIVSAQSTASTQSSSTPAPSSGTLLTFSAPQGTRSVSVAGDFNNWSVNANPLSDPDGDGIWSCEIKLPTGKYQYKFVVNGEIWLIDPNNSKKVPDGLGGENSSLEVSSINIREPSAESISADSAKPAETAETVKPQGFTVFHFKAPPGAHTVSLVGTFNDWDMNAKFLNDDDKDGIWEAKAVLPDGHHEYKYVINGWDWVRDPENPKTISDMAGGENSVIEIKNGRAFFSEANSRSEELDLWSPEKPHRFVFHSSAPANKVFVAGSFNNWSSTAAPMINSGDNEWTADFFLPQGKTLYKYVVDGRWLPDTENPLREDDNYGSYNSVVLSGDWSAPDTNSIRGDGIIYEPAIAHRHSSVYESRLDEMTGIFRVRFDRDDISKLFLIFPADTIEMNLYTGDERFEYWQTEAKIFSDTITYTFLIEDGDNKFLLGRNSLIKSSSIKPFTLAPAKPFRIPAWLDGAVIYHIFPDRFSNGDNSNDPSNTREWRYESLPKSEVGWSARYGGDISGVISNLDYLTELGITAIKFNPIFSAPSSNKYDATDYYSIDPEFGTNEIFRKLLDSAKSRNISIILDGVYNHSGEKHPFFIDAAKNGPASIFYKCYNIKKWPFPERFESSGANAPNNYYESWRNFGWLPEFNSENPLIRAYLFGAVRQWMDMGVMGWRLDAAEDVESSFWREFRRTVKCQNSDAFIVGEVWREGSEWLSGDQFDATTNYPLRSAIIDYIVSEKIGAEEFLNRVGELLSKIPYQASRMQFNMLSSHDVPRIMTLANNNVDKVKLAIALQFSLPGIPVIYYGDEIGMEGGEDPDNRRAFPLSKENWNESIFNLTKKLIQIRKEHNVLRKGSWVPIYSSGKVLAVSITGEEEEMILVMNASDEKSSGFEFHAPENYADGVYEDLLSEVSLEVKEEIAKISELDQWSIHFFIRRKK